MNAIQQLERGAVEAHRRGETWATFWQMHGDAVIAVEPWNRQRFRQLANRLLALVASGDTDGQRPIGDDDVAPWEVDDVAGCDVCTTAKCLFPLRPVRGVASANQTAIN